MGFNDSIEQNASSFTVEVRDLNAKIKTRYDVQMYFLDSRNGLHIEERDTKQSRDYRRALSVILICSFRLDS